MAIDQKKEIQKKRLAKQLRVNLMRRKVQTRQRITENIVEVVVKEGAVEENSNNE